MEHAERGDYLIRRSANPIPVLVVGHLAARGAYVSLLMRLVAVGLVGLRASSVCILAKYRGAREVPLIALAQLHLSRFSSSSFVLSGRAFYG